MPRCVWWVTARRRTVWNDEPRFVCEYTVPQLHRRSSRHGRLDPGTDQDIGSLPRRRAQRLSRRPLHDACALRRAVELVPGTLAFDLPVWDGLRFLGQVTAASHFGWPPRPSASSVPTMAWLRVSDAARSPIISAGSTLASPVPLRLSQFSSVASGPAIPALRLVVFAVSGALPHGSSGTAVWPYESLAETAPIGGLVAKVRPPDRREPSHHHWMGQQEVRQ